MVGTILVSDSTILDEGQTLDTVTPCCSFLHPKPSPHSHCGYLYPSGSLPSLYPELSKAPQFRFHQAQGQTSSLPSSPPWLSHSTVLTLTSDPRSSFRLPLCLPPSWHARVPGRELPLLPPLPTLMPFRSSCIIVLFPSSLMSCWLLGAGYMGPDLFLSEVGYWPATPISP